MSDVIETEIRRKVIQWLNYADEDLRLARHALTLATGVPYRPGFVGRGGPACPPGFD